MEINGKSMGNHWKSMGNQWKSMGNHWKSMGNHWKSMGNQWEIIGNQWEIIGNQWEISGNQWEIIGNQWEIIGNQWEISGNQWKSVEIRGNQWEISGNQWKSVEIRGNPWTSIVSNTWNPWCIWWNPRLLLLAEASGLKGQDCSHLPYKSWCYMTSRLIVASFVHVSTFQPWLPINLTRYSMARYDKCSDWSTEEQQIHRSHIISRPHPDPARPWAGPSWNSWNSWKLGARLAEPRSSQTRPSWPILDHRHFLTHDGSEHGAARNIW